MFTELNLKMMMWLVVMVESVTGRLMAIALGSDGAGNGSNDKTHAAVGYFFGGENNDSFAVVLGW